MNGLSIGGKTLLSRIDPAGKAERYVESIEIRERTLYLCPSPLYGYGLSLLLKRITANSAVLCVESENELFNLSQTEMKPLLDEWKGRLVLLKTGTDSDGAPAVCKMTRNIWGERSFRRVQTLRLTGGWQLYSDYYEKLADILQKDIAVSWGNAITLIRLGRLYCRNFIRNISLLSGLLPGPLPGHKPISALNYNSDPVLVLGAGPSLDILLGALNASGILSAEKRPFRIICADTCLPALKDRGITPDLAVILESQHWNLRDFRGSRNSRIAAAVDMSALPASARVLDGEIFLTMTPWTELRLFDRLGQTGLMPPELTPLGSVGLTAIEIACRLTNGPVISGGIDFSFTIDAYHARSTPGHREKLETLNRFGSPVNAKAAFREGTYTTEAKTGKTVRSDPVMRNYRALYESEFGQEKKLFETEGPGLFLGTQILSIKDTVNILSGHIKPVYKKNSAETKNRPLAFILNDRADNIIAKNTLINFINAEKEKLVRLKNILTGSPQAAKDELEKILDECDYLWAHFPECAGAGGKRPDASDLSFLKRIRMEIDPYLKLWEMTQASL